MSSLHACIVRQQQQQKQSKGAKHMTLRVNGIVGQLWPLKDLASKVIVILGHCRMLLVHISTHFPHSGPSPDHLLTLLRWSQPFWKANLFIVIVLSRCGLDSWLKLRKLGVRLGVGLGLSLCAVPLLQFGSQRSEEVGLEHRSKVVAWTVIKTVNDEEGTNSRRRRQEEFVPNRQEDVEHNEESIKVDRSQSKLTWVCLSRYLN